jgi:hypothetical protein
MAEEEGFLFHIKCIVINAKLSIDPKIHPKTHPRYRRIDSLVRQSCVSEMQERSRALRRRFKCGRLEPTPKKQPNPEFPLQL